jgi:hypothetical protein
MRLRQLDRRVRLLEATVAGRAIHNPLLILVDLPGPHRKLGVNEHVVIDRFRDTGRVVWGQERITSDPDDDGRTCEPGGYILGLLERFHQTCHWRTVSGTCRMCAGTPVAASDLEKRLTDD